MDGVLEGQRRAHEEIDRLEQQIVEELLDSQPTQRSRLMLEHTTSNILDQMQETAQHLKSLYSDADLERQKEIDSITVSSEFGDFYARLKEVKDAHRRYPTDRPIDDSEFEAIVNSCRIGEETFDGMFSGEEMHGKYLDLVLPYQKYVNLKGVRKLDYLQYLDEFDNFQAIPTATKLSHAYSKYMEELEVYFERYFKLARPLFDYASMKENLRVEFEQLWIDAKIIGWEEAARKESSGGESIFCGPCNKIFTNKSVYTAHLAGKKHLKAAENYKEGGHLNQSPGVEPIGGIMSNSKNLAMKEFLIAKYAQELGQVRSETRSSVERKQSRTLEEREEDIVVEEAAPIEEVEEEEDDDGHIYNPLNLPLDWDGKPIPFWLWKLHGLGVRFPCEICGNHVYMGKKAFDQHFFEWRHSNGMKALGIPNTKHFFQITQIEEAQALWDKLKQATRLENFRPEAMEEFEDHQGNVYNRKTYEDLRRQGLI